MEIAWQGFKDRIDNEPGFYEQVRVIIEDPELAAKPALSDLPDPTGDLRYASHPEAVDLLRHVGLQGWLAGFFGGNLRAMAGPRGGERGSMLAPGRPGWRAGAGGVASPVAAPSAGAVASPVAAPSAGPVPWA
jgi:hypothetical protein